MFVVSRRNIILPGPNGEKFHMPKDYTGPVPAWAEGSPYLKALEADGKIIISASGKDKDIDAAEREKKGRGKKPPKTPEQEDTAEEVSERESPETSEEETPEES